MSVWCVFIQDRTNELNDKEKDIFSISRDAIGAAAAHDRQNTRFKVARALSCGIEREEQNDDNNRQSEMEAISHKEFQLMALDRLTRPKRARRV